LQQVIINAFTAFKIKIAVVGKVNESFFIGNGFVTED
jgi:hypothetical protein